MPSEESMIEDLRELEAELREKEEYRKANIIDLFIKYSTHCKIDKSKAKELKEKIHNELDKNGMVIKEIIIYDCIDNFFREE